MYHDSKAAMSAPPLLRNPGNSMSPSPRMKTLSLAIPTSPSLVPTLAGTGSVGSAAVVDERGFLLPQQPVPELALSTSPAFLATTGGSGDAMQEEPPSFYLNSGNSASRNRLQLNTGIQQPQHEAMYPTPQPQLQTTTTATATATQPQFYAQTQTTPSPSSMMVDSEPMGYSDVADLDEEGWERVANSGEIVEIAKLGEGTSGSVTKCRLRYGKTVFALKTIPANPNPDIRKQILRELLFNKTCDSPHIVKYYGRFVDEQNASISIAMEYCAGRSLDAVYKHVKARGGRIGERVLGKIAEGVLSGLSYLHERKIIHRDIKPQNILLDGNGQVKLCDFGVSGEVVNSLATTFTGTSYYMAPERIQGHPYSVTSDIWSLGLTLMEVAHHRFPFPPEGEPTLSAIEILVYIVHNPPPKLMDEPHNGIKWSEAFHHFLACCLEKDTKKRASPRQMLKHPWIVGISSRKVKMDRFVQECWADATL
ncbi:mitogen-activated protein kinase [Myxozyma melibiosi]|uniref:Mitogen-activated protein kinase n=1 Tax=Myxozyma melibiosi TaxID=54550 RepID=A0ABR1F5X7_9ASCO